MQIRNRETLGISKDSKKSPGISSAGVGNPTHQVSITLSLLGLKPKGDKTCKRNERFCNRVPPPLLLVEYSIAAPAAKWEQINDRSTIS